MNSKLNDTKEWISWKTVVEITNAEPKKEKRMKRNEDSLRDLWDNSKHTNIHIIGVPEGEEKKVLITYLKT